MDRRLAGLLASGALLVVLGALSILAWTSDDDDTAAGATGSPAASPSAGLAGAGRDVFQRKGCAGCHHVALEGITGGLQVGPDLSLLAREAGERVDGLSAEAYVRASIREPDAFIVPGYASGGASPMPIIPVSDDELDALVAFLMAER